MKYRRFSSPALNLNRKASAFHHGFPLAFRMLSSRISSSRNLHYFFYSSIRHASSVTRQLHPAVRQLASELGQKQPAFAVSPNDVHVLKQPSEFYSRLLEMIQRAERRIFLSSLYIGSSEGELVENLEKALRHKESLHLYFQLDLNRSTRPGASSTAKILLSLLQTYPDRVHASFFRSPNLRGIMAKVVPPRFNEGWGTWHAKIYGADDDVMISGTATFRS
uniref:CDP-diacylglycerol--glycerol-3-phosphate 3-phosphatidyltransferase n=1 Tax=Moniliophthora roreri TaxID=221103 RepID=A0A0W0F6X7_MONRR